MRSANMVVLTNQIKRRWPGVVVYGIGDAAHQGSASGHNEDDTPGSRPEDQDADNKPEHRALDVMLGPAFSRTDANYLVHMLVSVPANRARLLYVIFDGYKWRRNGGWVREVHTGDPHRDHPHISGEADDDENTSPWILDPQPVPAPSSGKRKEPVMYFFAKTADGPRWAVVSGGSWFEFSTQEDADHLAGALGAKDGEKRSAEQCSPASYARLKAEFTKFD